MAANKSRQTGAVARNLKGLRHLYRTDLIARVESEDDIQFWQNAISKGRPGKKVKFLPAEISEANADVRQRGKGICMRYVRHLDNTFIICVDSDFDKFVNPGKLTPQKHILQTHTYSWENHHCQYDNLQNVWKSVGNSSFDFKIFLHEFSRIIYPALICMLTSLSMRKRSWNLRGLCGSILSCQPNRQGALDNNGQQLLEEIKAKVDLWISEQAALEEADKDSMKSLCASVGLQPDNAYLYMQGHCVFDLIYRIGNALCNGTHSFEYEVLRNTISYGTYKEIQEVIDDIQTVIA